MLVHELWDFGLTSSVSGTTLSALGIALFVLADNALAVVLIRRPHIAITPPAN